MYNTELTQRLINRIETVEKFNDLAYICEDFETFVFEIWIPSTIALFVWKISHNNFPSSVFFLIKNQYMFPNPNISIFTGDIYYSNSSLSDF